MISIKIILCILVVAAGVFSGQLKAHVYANRVAQLQQLITTLKLLKSEMKYRLDPLPEVLERMSQNRSDTPSVFFHRISELVKSDESCDFNRCWNEAVNEIYHESTLSRKDVTILKEVGMELGKTDMEGQLNLFERTLTLLEEQVKEALEEKKVKGKMYKSLGAAVGILIVILFI